jgi:hypothetical protein
MCCAWFSPDIALCIQAKEYHFVSSHHIIFFLMISVFHVPFCKLQACCHVPFSQEWLLSGHSPIKPRFVRCCRDCSVSEFSSVYPISVKELCSCVRVVIGFLVTSLTKILLAQLLSLVGRTALASSIFFQFPNDGDHCALRKDQHSRHCFIVFPRYICLITILSRRSTDSSSYSFSSDMWDLI